MYNVTLSLDRENGLPIYEQLYRYFTGEIHSGRLKAGEKLPSKRALCQHLNISCSTVETAYGLLTAEGFAEARPKSGYYVLDYTTLDTVHDNNESKSAATETKQEKQAAISSYFSTSAVDTSLFPYSSWARLTKRVVYDCPFLLQRGDMQGELSLREALASFLSQYRGVRCTSDQIVVGAGMEYLTEILIKLFSEDAVFALEDPGYSSISRILHNNGRQVKYVELDEFGMNAKKLYKSGASVAYITPSHQFPMGITMPAGRRSQILHWASQKENRYVIEDDYDSEFRYSSRPIPAMQSLDAMEKVIYVGTFSRSIAPSIRVAYMVLPYKLLSRYREVFEKASSTVSRYEQEVLARFINEGYYSRYLRKVGNLYKNRCEKLCAELLGIDGIHIAGNGGGIHFLAWSDNLTGEQMYERALYEGIMVHKLSDYCREAKSPLQAVVVGFGGADDNKRNEIIARLKKAWK